MMTLTHYGIREWGLGALAAVLLGTGFVTLARHGYPATGWTLTALTVLAWLALAAFFRNPSRRIPADPLAVVSPADGVVKDIGIVDFDQAPFEGKALRIGIFLSVLDVHVNRAPAAWKIAASVYREGRSLDARDPDCARENEAMTLSGTASIGERTFPLAVRQISGAIARRIVCPVVPGRAMERGEVYGMIKFGSRTELYLPTEGFEITVRIGDKVRGGSDILAKAVNP